MEIGHIGVLKNKFFQPLYFIKLITKKVMTIINTSKKLIFLLLHTAIFFGYSQYETKDIGQVSIFEEPTKEELKNWKEFDYFLIETYNYVKKEKTELKSKSNNPFTDSIFIKKFKNVTYKIIYDSAKAFRDSAYHKSPERGNYQNISEWASYKFPIFSKFNREYNKYLNN